MSKDINAIDLFGDSVLSPVLSINIVTELAIVLGSRTNEMVINNLTTELAPYPSLNLK